MYVRNDYAADMKEIISFSNGVVDVIGVHSKVNNMVITAIYRHPDDPIGGHRSGSADFKEALSFIRD